MALVCPSTLDSTSLGFTEFIDCKTVSITYDTLGIASLSFTVIAAEAQPINSQVYTDVTFGGVNFTGHIVDLTIKRIAGTIVYEHSYSLSTIGCKV